MLAPLFDQLISCDVLQNWFDLNFFTHHANQFRLQILQFTMALCDNNNNNNNIFYLNTVGFKANIAYGAV